MTELGIEEIASVLQAKDFLPCKRDIQKQLTSLLQSRPNQIRPRGHVTKAQVKILRDCKSVRVSKKTQADAEDDCEFGHSLTSLVTSPSPRNLYYSAMCDGWERPEPHFRLFTPSLITATSPLLIRFPRL
ncbi:hypothetical protein BKA61DRAFT_659991 [Leptodontidium sp. MPI-SDFR-AT-0119]|nr:hypothetical protein BKA61DRAFT_659991 [Leptodontidium sp. MPI-SDFR-AT-0119]